VVAALVQPGIQQYDVAGGSTDVQTRDDPEDPHETAIVYRPVHYGFIC
jgi:hypothetical protein